MTEPSASAPAAPSATPQPSARAAGRERRALVFAGGGLKVAYQAGALQVLLDEAGMDFDLADGASGGVFNLAMWCQGMSGRQIADNWRAYRPLHAFTPNLGAWLRGPWGASVLTFGGLRRRILTGFGMDWHAIRTTEREAVFELFNVSRQRLESVPAAEITEERLLSAVALPMWFPPARIDGAWYIDAVFATDGNLEEMIRRGASELWVIWTVSTRGTWRPGFVPEYFEMIEASANSRLRAALQRIEQSNADLAAGRPSSFGRHVTVHLLSGEVPMGYLLVLRRKTMQRAVELGVRETRQWCARHDIALGPGAPLPGTTPPATGTAGTAADAGAAAAESLSFCEVMTGSVTMGEPPGGVSKIRLDLDVTIGDIAAFVADPAHVAAVNGTVSCAAFGGQLAIRSGRLSLLADAPGTLSTEKHMTYDLRVTDARGRRLQLVGVKRLTRGARPSVWSDTTTLTAEVRDEATGSVVAAGIARISLPGFLRELTTFRTDAGGGRRAAGGRAAALARFGDFFADQLWQVYGQPVRRAAAQAWLRKAAR
jgi:predicted acylesterase/phospholipase RssA